jgi:predicted ATPase
VHISLALQHEYRSIKTLEASDLPTFVVLTGANGSGKTHLLESIARGSTLVKIDDEIVREGEILHFPLSSLKTQTIGYASEYESNARALSLAIPIVESYRGRYCTFVRQAIDLGQTTDIWNVRDEILFELSGNETVEKYSTQAGTPEGVEIAAKIDLYEDQSYRSRGGIHPQTASAILLIDNASRVLAKPVHKLRPADLQDRFLLANEFELFNQSFARLFSTYRDIAAENEFRQFRSSKGLEVRGPVLSDHVLKIQIGLPPWDEMNALLERFGYTFQINRPDDDHLVPYSPRLTHTISGVEIGFEDLSSGENVFLAILVAAFNLTRTADGFQRARLVLLDEFDASLHPSMISDVLRTIENLLVKGHKIAVIATTHSPTTVALAPAGSVFGLKDGVLEPDSQNAAVRSLTHGIPYLRVSNDNRVQVFVESEYDAERFEEIVQAGSSTGLLQLNCDLRFAHFGRSKGTGGCAGVLQIVPSVRINGAGNFFGVVDSDGGRNAGIPGKVLLLGDGKRYSADNYFIDPVLIAALSLRLGWTEPGNPGRTSMGLPKAGILGGLEKRNDALLQQAADAVIDHVDKERRKFAGDRVSCELLSGAVVELPMAWLSMNGKDLFKLVKEAIPAMTTRYGSEVEFIKDILRFVVVPEVGLVSADFRETFCSLETLSKTEN